LRRINDLVADLTGQDESAAEAAAHELAKLGKAGSEAVLGLLGSEHTEHRWWAVRTMAAMANPPTDHLLRALVDPEAEVRAAAALALAAHPDESAAAPLARALEDEDNVVAVLAVSALTKLGGAAVPMLIEAFDSATPRGKIQIMRALAELRDPRSIKLMMTAQETHSAALHYWAQAGLERLGLDMVYMRPD